MPSQYNVTLELQLRGPTNTSQVVGDLRRQLAAAGTVNLDTSRATSNLAATQSALQRVREQAAAASSSFRATAAVTLDATRAVESFGHQAGLALKRFTAFTAAAGTMLQVARAIRAGVSAAIEFDLAMNKVAQVSDEAGGRTAAVREQISSLATGLGVSSQQLAQVAITAKQAGFNLRETADAVRTVALTDLAPSFDSMAQSMEGLIAVSRQFRLESSRFQEAFGGINAVSAAFAVESADIIEAVKKAGGSFAAIAGQTKDPIEALSEFQALFTSVRATTRESAEAIATGLRTIFTRFQRADTVDALRELGVNLRFTREEALALGETDLEDQFVGPYEAVRRLSEGLRGLRETDPRFAAVVEQLGGYRQISRVIPLLKQFEDAERARGVALAGGISLQSAAEKRQEAFANKLAKTKETYLEVARGVFDSQGFQSTADALLKLANAFAKVVEYATPLLPVLTAIAGVKLFQSAGNLIGGFITGVRPQLPAAQAAVSPVAPRRFASGGVVPGSGWSDSVPAMLTPGEYVIRRDSAQEIGYDRLEEMNRQGFAGGGRAAKKFSPPKNYAVGYAEGGRPYPPEYQFVEGTQGFTVRGVPARGARPSNVPIVRYEDGTESSVATAIVEQLGEPNHGIPYNAMPLSQLSPHLRFYGRGYYAGPGYRPMYDSLGIRGSIPASRAVLEARKEVPLLADPLADFDIGPGVDRSRAVSHLREQVASSTWHTVLEPEAYFTPAEAARGLGFFARHRFEIPARNARRNVSRRPGSGGLSAFLAAVDDELPATLAHLNRADSTRFIRGLLREEAGQGLTDDSRLLLREFIRGGDPTAGLVAADSLQEQSTPHGELFRAMVEEGRKYGRFNAGGNVRKKMSFEGEPYATGGFVFRGIPSLGDPALAEYGLGELGMAIDAYPDQHLISPLNKDRAKLPSKFIRGIDVTGRRQGRGPNPYRIGSRLVLPGAHIPADPNGPIAAVNRRGTDGTEYGVSRAVESRLLRAAGFGTVEDEDGEFDGAYSERNAPLARLLNSSLNHFGQAVVGRTAAVVAEDPLLYAPIASQNRGDAGRFIARLLREDRGVKLGRDALAGLRAFHRDNDQTGALVAADWVQEFGSEEHAELLRKLIFEGREYGRFATGGFVFRGIPSVGVRPRDEGALSEAFELAGRDVAPAAHNFPAAFLRGLRFEDSSAFLTADYDSRLGSVGIVRPDRRLPPGHYVDDIRGLLSVNALNRIGRLAYRDYPPDAYGEPGSRVGAGAVRSRAARGAVLAADADAFSPSLRAIGEYFNNPALRGILSRSNRGGAAGFVRSLLAREAGSPLTGDEQLLLRAFIQQGDFTAANVAADSIQERSEDHAQLLRELVEEGRKYGRFAEGGRPGLDSYRGIPVITGGGRGLRNSSRYRLDTAFNDTHKGSEPALSRIRVTEGRVPYFNVWEEILLDQQFGQDGQTLLAAGSDAPSSPAERALHRERQSPYERDALDAFLAGGQNYLPGEYDIPSAYVSAAANARFELPDFVKARGVAGLIPPGGGTYVPGPAYGVPASHYGPHRLINPFADHAADPRFGAFLRRRNRQELAELFLAHSGATATDSLRGILGDFAMGPAGEVTPLLVAADEVQDYGGERQAELLRRFAEEGRRYGRFATGGSVFRGVPLYGRLSDRNRELLDEVFDRNISEFLHGRELADQLNYNQTTRSLRSDGRPAIDVSSLGYAPGPDGYVPAVTARLRPARPVGDGSVHLSRYSGPAEFDEATIRAALVRAQPRLGRNIESRVLSDNFVDERGDPFHDELGNAVRLSAYAAGDSRIRAFARRLGFPEYENPRTAEQRSAIVGGIRRSNRGAAARFVRSLLAREKDSPLTDDENILLRAFVSRGDLTAANVAADSIQERSEDHAVLLRELVEQGQKYGRFAEGGSFDPLKATVVAPKYTPKKKQALFEDIVQKPRRPLGERADDALVQALEILTRAKPEGYATGGFVLRGIPGFGQLPEGYGPFVEGGLDEAARRRGGARLEPLLASLMAVAAPANTRSGYLGAGRDGNAHLHEFPEGKGGPGWLPADVTLSDAAYGRIHALASFDSLRDGLDQNPFANLVAEADLSDATDHLGFILGGVRENRFGAGDALRLSNRRQAAAFVGSLLRSGRGEGLSTDAAATLAAFKKSGGYHDALVAADALQDQSGEHGELFRRLVEEGYAYGRFAEGGRTPLFASYRPGPWAFDIGLFSERVAGATGLNPRALVGHVKELESLGPHGLMSGEGLASFTPRADRSPGLIKLRGPASGAAYYHELGHALDNRLASSLLAPEKISSDAPDYLTRLSDGDLSHHFPIVRKLAGQLRSASAEHAEEVLLGPYLRGNGELNDEIFGYLSSPSEGFAELFADYNDTLGRSRFSPEEPSGKRLERLKFFGEEVLPFARGVLGQDEFPEMVQRLRKLRGFAEGGPLRAGFEIKDFSGVPLVGPDPDARVAWLLREGLAARPDLPQLLPYIRTLTRPRRSTAGSFFVPSTYRLKPGAGSFGRVAGVMDVLGSVGAGDHYELTDRSFEFSVPGDPLRAANARKTSITSLRRGRDIEDFLAALSGDVRQYFDQPGPTGLRELGPDGERVYRAFAEDNLQVGSTLLRRSLPAELRKDDTLEALFKAVRKDAREETPRSEIIDRLMELSPEAGVPVQNALTLRRLGRFAQGGAANARKYFSAFASGGHSSDTVPAMLTPGEFVFSREAASSIGLPQLERMNKHGARAVQHFARGGVVRGFAEGDPVGPAPGATPPVTSLNEASAAFQAAARDLSKSAANVEAAAGELEVATGKLAGARPGAQPGVPTQESVKPALTAAEERIARLRAKSAQQKAAAPQPEAAQSAYTPTLAELDAARAAAEAKKAQQLAAPEAAAPPESGPFRNKRVTVSESLKSAKSVDELSRVSDEERDALEQAKLAGRLSRERAERARAEAAAAAEAKAAGTYKTPEEELAEENKRRKERGLEAIRTVQQQKDLGDAMRDAERESRAGERAAISPQAAQFILREEERFRADPDDRSNLIRLQQELAERQGFAQKRFGPQVDAAEAAQDALVAVAEKSAEPGFDRAKAPGLLRSVFEAQLLNQARRKSEAQAGETEDGRSVLANVAAPSAPQDLLEELAEREELAASAPAARPVGSAALAAFPAVDRRGEAVEPGSRPHLQGIAKALGVKAVGSERELLERVTEAYARLEPAILEAEARGLSREEAIAAATARPPKGKKGRPRKRRRAAARDVEDRPREDDGSRPAPARKPRKKKFVVRSSAEEREARREARPKETPEEKYERLRAPFPVGENLTHEEAYRRSGLAKDRSGTQNLSGYAREDAERQAASLPSRTVLNDPDARGPLDVKVGPGGEYEFNYLPPGTGLTGADSYFSRQEGVRDVYSRIAAAFPQFAGAEAGTEAALRNAGDGGAERGLTGQPGGLDVQLGLSPAEQKAVLEKTTSFGKILRERFVQMAALAKEMKDLDQILADADTLLAANQLTPVEALPVRKAVEAQRKILSGEADADENARYQAALQQMAQRPLGPPGPEPVRGRYSPGEYATFEEYLADQDAKTEAQARALPPPAPPQTYSERTLAVRDAQGYYAPASPLAPGIVNDAAKAEYERRVRELGGADRVSGETKEKILSEELLRKENEVRRELISAEERLLRALGVAEQEVGKLARENVGAALAGADKVAVAQDGRLLGTAASVRRAEEQGVAAPGAGRRGFVDRAADFIGQRFDAVRGAFGPDSAFGRANQRLGALGAGIDPTGNTQTGLLLTLPYLGAAASSLAGSAEDRARAGQDDAFIAGRAAGGAIQSATVGATVGSVLGPVGTVAGAAGGALLGFVTAVQDAKRELSQARLGEALNVFADRLAGLNAALGSAGTVNPALDLSAVSEASRGLETADRERQETARLDAKRFLGLGFSPESYLASLARQRREAAGQLPGLQQFLATQAQQAGRANPEGDRRELFDRVLGGNLGLNRRSFDTIAETRQVSADTLRKEFEKAVVQGQRAARVEEASREADRGQGQATAAFGRLLLSLKSAADGLSRLERESGKLAAAFEGVSQPAQVSLGVERLDLIGANRPDTLESLDVLSRVGGPDAERLRANAAAFEVATRSLYDALPGTLNRTGLSGAPFTTDVLDRVRAAAGGETPELKTLFATLRANLEKELEADGGTTAIRDRLQQDPAKFFDRLLGGADLVRATARQSAQALEDQLNLTTQRLNAFERQLQAAGQTLDEQARTRAQGTRTLAQFAAEREGRAGNLLDRTPLSELNAGLDARQNRLAGLGAASADPEVVGRELRGTRFSADLAEDRFQRVVRATGGNSPAALAAAGELERLKARALDLTQALKNLTDVSERTAAAQEKLSRLRQEEDSRLSLGERYLTAEPEERLRLDRGFSLAAQAYGDGSGNLLGLSAADRRNALESLRAAGGATLPLPGSPTGTDAANALIRNSGFDLSPEQKRERDALQKAVADAFATADKAFAELAAGQKTLSDDFFANLKRAHEEFFARLAQQLAQSKLGEAEGRRVSAAAGLAGAEELRGQRAVLQGFGFRDAGQVRDANLRKAVEEYANSIGEQEQFSTIRNRRFEFNDEFQRRYNELRERRGGRPTLQEGLQLRDEVLRDRLGGKYNDRLKNDILGKTDFFGLPLNFDEQIFRATTDKIREVGPRITDSATTIDAAGLNREAIRQAALNPERFVALQKAIETFSKGDNSFDKVDKDLEKFGDALRNATEEVKRLRDAGVAPAAPGGGGAVERLAAGGSVFRPSGTDTVPAMLTPGEFVVNAASSRANRPLLERLNDARGTLYLADGGPVAAPADREFEAAKQAQLAFLAGLDAEKKRAYLREKLGTDNPYALLTRDDIAGGYLTPGLRALAAAARENFRATVSGTDAGRATVQSAKDEVAGLTAKPDVANLNIPRADAKAREEASYREAAARYAGLSKNILFLQATVDASGKELAAGWEYYSPEQRGRIRALREAQSAYLTTKAQEALAVDNPGKAAPNFTKLPEAERKALEEAAYLAAREKWRGLERAAEFSDKPADYGKTLRTFLDVNREKLDPREAGETRNKIEQFEIWTKAQNDAKLKAGADAEKAQAIAAPALGAGAGAAAGAGQAVLGAALDEGLRFEARLNPRGASAIELARRGPAAPARPAGAGAGFGLLRGALRGQAASDRRDRLREAELARLGRRADAAAAPARARNERDDALAFLAQQARKLGGPGGASGFGVLGEAARLESERAAAEGAYSDALKAVPGGSRVVRGGFGLLRDALLLEKQKARINARFAPPARRAAPDPARAAGDLAFAGAVEDFNERSRLANFRPGGGTVFDPSRRADPFAGRDLAARDRERRLAYGAAAFRNETRDFDRYYRPLVRPQGLFGQRFGGGPFGNGALRFASGGPVPGYGSRDTVPALLTPGEFVLNRAAVARAGGENLQRFNDGGPVRPAAGGSARGAGLDSSELVRALAEFGRASQALAQSVVQFNGNAQALAESINRMPRQLTGNFTHTVNVNHNGAEALGRLSQEMRAVAVEETKKILRRVFREQLPDANVDVDGGE